MRRDRCGDRRNAKRAVEEKKVVQNAAKVRRP